MILYQLKQDVNDLTSGCNGSISSTWKNVDPIGAMLNLCINYVIVSDTFYAPVPKKSQRTIPHYPKTIDRLLSPLLQILYCSTGHCFSKYQFGCVDVCNTSMRLPIVNDVISYSNDGDSCICLFSKGAFDNIP